MGELGAVRSSNRWRGPQASLLRPQEDGLQLTPRKVDTALRTALPLDALFFDNIWPQLEGHGWARAAPHGGAGSAFYPPQAPSTSAGEPQGIASVKGVFQHLQAHPEHLPPPPPLRLPPLLQQQQPARPAAPAAALGAAGQPAYIKPEPAQRPQRALPAPRGFASVGVKVCENCGTTSTPLWRKDRQVRVVGMISLGPGLRKHWQRLCNPCALT